MGDIADMMLDGTLCEWCGVYIEGETEYTEYVDWPRLCKACGKEAMSQGYEIRKDGFGGRRIVGKRGKK